MTTEKTNTGANAATTKVIRWLQNLVAKSPQGPAEWGSAYRRPAVVTSEARGDVGKVFLGLSGH
jgi:hypothetical protein